MGALQLARVAVVVALGFGSPGSVEWLRGPLAPVLVCLSALGPCRVDVPASPSCAGGPAVSVQWSPFGTSSTRADFSVVVMASGPLAAVSIVRPGLSAVAASWGASGDGASVFRWASTNVAPAGQFEIAASDARGCVAHVRGRRI